jgi:hypothetical protein
MRTKLLVIRICLLSLAIPGFATLASDAQTIELNQNVVGFAPGAYYKVEISTSGTLSVS